MRTANRLREIMEKQQVTAFELAKTLSANLGRPIGTSSVYFLMYNTKDPKALDVVNELCFILDTTPERIFPKMNVLTDLTIEQAINLRLITLPEQPDKKIIYRDCIKLIMQTLTREEKFVILHYFGFIDNKEWSLEDIGKKMGKIFKGERPHSPGKPFTRERIRQIAEEALKKSRALF